MKFKTIHCLLKESERIVSQSCLISIITNVVLEPHFTPFLKQCFANSSITAEIEMITLDELSNKIPKGDLIVVLLHFETQHPNWYNDIVSKKLSFDSFQDNVLFRCHQIYHFLKSKSSAPILWFGYEDYSNPIYEVCGAVTILGSMLEEINSKIRSMLEREDCFIDTNYLISHIGILNSYDNKNKYRWNMPYSQALLQELADEIYRQYQISHGVTKKCLVLDCDGVLWGGILSEDGIEGIKLGNEGLGRQYQDFQRFLLSLYYHGVILAICSKNNLEDVLQVFRKHSGMILKETQIACFQVNYENKPENILKIAALLNLSPDSIVFVDDSSFEVEAVRTMLPDVKPILYNYKTVYKELSCFHLKSAVNLEQVEKRNETYQSNYKREQLCTESLDFKDYLKALQMTVDIHLTRPDEYARIAELSQRTNQCTNGIRYTVTDLKSKCADSKYQLFSVYVSDRFSDLGLVGAIGLDGRLLDLFSLSCRALGRKVEKTMVETALKNGVQFFRFVSTHKNESLFGLLNEVLHEEQSGDK